MPRRSAKTTGATRGAAWRKAPPAEAAPPLGVRLRVTEGRLCTAVNRASDAAALVEMVRLCQQHARPIPAWVVEALEDWLSDFINLARTRKPGPFSRWARAWHRAFLDEAIADELETGREAYGLTWAEAADRAHADLAGTPAAGSPDALLVARKRALKRRKALGARPFTAWELAQWRAAAPDARRSTWFAANADRMGNERGEWAARPALQYPRRRA